MMCCCDMTWSHSLVTWRTLFILIYSFHMTLFSHDSCYAKWHALVTWNTLFTLIYTRLIWHSSHNSCYVHYALQHGISLSHEILFSHWYTLFIWHSSHISVHIYCHMTFLCHVDVLLITCQKFYLSVHLFISLKLNFEKKSILLIKVQPIVLDKTTTKTSPGWARGMATFTAFILVADWLSSWTEVTSSTKRLSRTRLYLQVVLICSPWRRPVVEEEEFYTPLMEINGRLAWWRLPPLLLLFSYFLKWFYIFSFGKWNTFSSRNISSPRTIMQLFDHMMLLFLLVDYTKQFSSQLSTHFC